MISPRRHPRPLVPAALLLVFAVAATACCAPASRLVLQSGSQLWLTGTSTLHPYSSTSTKTEVFVELESPAVDLSTVPASAILESIVQRGPFKRFELTVPVIGLKSGESGLDKNMYKALKSESAPAIRFVLTHYETLASSPGGGGFPIKASGHLAIAGVEKEITLNGTAQISPNGLTAEGEYRLLMSDYGVRPPTLLFGAIKVADPVVIHYHLIFDINPAPQGAAVTHERSLR